MQQITRAIYIVDANETVTVEVEAIKVNNFITFSIDGMPLPSISETPRTYRFNVTIGAGLTHFGIVTCFFPDSAPDDAMYQVFVTGSQGGGRFTGSNILKTNLSWSRGLEFRRV